MLRPEVHIQGNQFFTYFEACVSTVAQKATTGCICCLSGVGYADLENRVPCGPDTVMRIASISKPLTAAAIARLWEYGKIDLDAPVQKYVPEFPKKQFEGEDVSTSI